MPKDMLEMWFGKTFNREGLDARTRLLVTIAALTVLGAQAEPQMRLTITPRAGGRGHASARSRK